LFPDSLFHANPYEKTSKLFDANYSTVRRSKPIDNPDHLAVGNAARRCNLAAKGSVSSGSDYGNPNKKEFFSRIRLSIGWH